MHNNTDSSSSSEQNQYRQTTPTKPSKKQFTKTPPKKSPVSHNIKSFFPPATPFVVLLEDLKYPPKKKEKEKEDVEQYKLTTTKTTTTTTTTIIENFFTPISPTKRQHDNEEENGGSEDENRKIKKKKEADIKMRGRKDNDKPMNMHIDSFFRIREEKTVRDVSVVIPVFKNKEDSELRDTHFSFPSKKNETKITPITNLKDKKREERKERKEKKERKKREESECESDSSSENEEIDFDTIAIDDSYFISDTEEKAETRRNSYGGVGTLKETDVVKRKGRRRSAPRVIQNDRKRRGRQKKEERQEGKEIAQGASDKTKKMTFPPAVDETGRIVCLFCRKSYEETTYEGKLMHEKKLDVHIHIECLYSASRAKDESIVQMAYRIAGKGRQTLSCKLCNKKHASLGCVVKTCAKIYHYKCGLEADGKWDPVTWTFYCKSHYAMHNYDMITDYKVTVKWPRDCKVELRRESIWDEIKKEHREIIARFARVEGPKIEKEQREKQKQRRNKGEIGEGEESKEEDENWTVAWENTSFVPRCEIRQIGPGHWAWCPDLSTGKSKPQYEAVAAQDIECDEFIGEYVGRVRYENQHSLRNPYVTSMFVPLLPQLRSLLGPSFSGLCIDSSAEGNETRFINSVTRHSPPHIRQNATMDTVWCRGQLRVIIRSIRRIPQGNPIVLNYDEYIKADGSHPYFDSDSDSETESQTGHAPYVVNNVVIPKSFVVIPYIDLPAKK